MTISQRTNPIDVSVIMSSYNNEDTILDAVSSILSQSFLNFEFLIVNDGSRDSTRAKLSDISDPRLRIIDNKENIGLTRSLNKAIALSTGRFVARQDADDISMPKRLEQQYNFLGKNPDIAMLGTGRATLDEKGEVLSVHMLPEKPDYNDLLKSNCFVHGSVMVRREVLDDIGQYNEDFKLTQDYELWLRISRKYRIKNLQEALYGIRRHTNRVTLSRLTEAGLYRFLAVNMSQGKVPDELMERIRQEGIEIYYDYLSRDERIKFHNKALIKYSKYGLYAEAEKHLRQLIRLAPSSLTLRTKLFFLLRRKALRSPD